MPTMDEINEKLKAFQESGVLDRDRLRGTVGYMAPELILTGRWQPLAGSHVACRTPLGHLESTDVSQYLKHVQTWRSIIE